MSCVMLWDRCAGHPSSIAVLRNMSISICIKNHFFHETKFLNSHLVNLLSRIQFVECHSLVRVSSHWTAMMGIFTEKRRTIVSELPIK